MKTREEIVQLLRDRREELHARFTARILGLFGSVARGTLREGSDVDLLLELDEPTFDHYMDLKFYLEDLFEAEVDLVLADTVKPRLKPYIERELLRV